MPVNAGPEYFAAERKYLAAKSKEEKIAALKEMIRLLPKHKGSEHQLSEFKRRLAKLKKQAETARRSGRGKPKFSIRKEGAATVCLVGLTNCGKSSLLNALTNAHAEVADYPYTTKLPEVGMMRYKDVQLQLIEVPSSFDSEMLSLLEIADECIVMIDATQEIEEQIKKLMKILQKAFDVDGRPYFFVATKADSSQAKLGEIRNEYGFLELSAEEGENLEELKGLMWKNLGMIRVYTKEPGKPKVLPAIALRKGASVEDVAEKIHKDFLKNFRFARIFNSTKFSGKTVGLDYRVEDEDVVEIHTK
ncbi:MAG TPA: GTPase [archaeon]|nr:GTPase [archaeon]